MKIIFLFTISFCFSQNIKFQIKDLITNEPIEFVSINLLNGHGLFANEKGEVNLNYTNIKTIELSHVSYEAEKIDVENIKSIVYLRQKANQLKEIELFQSLKKVYQSKKNIKAKDSLYCGFGAYGFELAIYINPELDKKCFLNQISIPITVDEHWMMLANIKEEPLSLIRISFLKSFNSKPIDSLLSEPEYFFIDNRTLKNKQIKYNLKNKLPLPIEGVFCVITFLGKADKKGNLIIEMPTYIVKTIDKEILFTRYQPLRVPINKTKNERIAYSRNSFINNSKFCKVIPPIAISANLSNEDRANQLEYKTEKMDNFTIDIGYEYFMYE
jgi:hypothetical protein